ncbi:response regulator [Paenibacillus thermoaerophilus]|uniref:Response regulator n=1 Tax=Paenibacillus thermoaerophilus TaxID=1215385 RepID=A0ABW2V967_9BACL|nr:response regulator [Paenibacillus thermoaerophilus]
MIRLVIVDDEPLERNALRKFVEQSALEIEVVGEAENGRKALEAAEELKPDLMTVDIRMPGLDGVEVVRLLSQRQPSITFMMISAYNTFEYARQVMQYGVKEFLTKPYKKKDILESFQRSIGEIRFKRYVRQADSLIEAERVRSILMGQTDGQPPDEWEPALRKRNGYAFVMVLQASGGSGELTREEKARLLDWVRLRFKEKFDCLVGKMTRNQIPVLVMANRNDTAPASVKGFATPALRQLIYQFDREFVGMELFVGIGNGYGSASQLTHSYQEALLASRSGVRSVPYAYYEDVKDKLQGEKTFPIELEKRLIACVKRGQAKEAAGLFEEYFLRIGPYFDFDRTAIKSCLQKLMLDMMLLFEEMGMDMGHKPPPMLTDADGQLQDTALCLIRQLAESAQNWYRTDPKGTLCKAKHFIEDHYDKDISLEQVADAIKLSPHYLSKMFKESCGMNFIDYLTRIRIDRAKELMMDPEVPFKEVCARVGYRDPNYFSRVFRKATGYPPTDYRLRFGRAWKDPSR